MGFELASFISLVVAMTRCSTKEHILLDLLTEEARTDLTYRLYGEQAAVLCTHI